MTPAEILRMQIDNLRLRIALAQANINLGHSQIELLTPQLVALEKIVPETPSA